jgi:hypothetical protein
MAMNAIDRAWCEAVHSLETCSLCGKYGIQWAHRNAGRGMGQKAPAWQTAALCPDCHHAIDNGKDLTQDERRSLMDRAIVLTHSRLIDAGKLILKVGK